MPQNLEVLTTAEKHALDELSNKSIARRSPQKHSYWCTGCIVDTENSKPVGSRNPHVVRFANCFEAGEQSGASVGWFDDFADMNGWCRKDSEILVLNQLDQKAKWYAGGGQTDLLLVMLGEFGPCASCRAALKHYRKYHNLPATILYREPFQASGKKPPAWPAGTTYGWEAATFTKDPLSVMRFP